MYFIRISGEQKKNEAIWIINNNREKTERQMGLSATTAVNEWCRRRSQMEKNSYDNCCGYSDICKR